MEPSGAVHYPLPTRKPPLSPFHAYIIAHNVHFVKWVLEKSLRFFENIFFGGGGVKCLMADKYPRGKYYIEASAT